MVGRKTSLAREIPWFSGIFLLLCKQIYFINKMNCIEILNSLKAKVSIKAV